MQNTHVKCRSRQVENTHMEEQIPCKHGYHWQKKTEMCILISDNVVFGENKINRNGEMLLWSVDPYSKPIQ